MSTRWRLAVPALAMFLLPASASGAPLDAATFSFSLGTLAALPLEGGCPS